MAHLKHPTDQHAHEAHEHDAHAHGNVGHLVSPKILVATAAALLMLTGITVLSVRIDFEQMDLPELNIAVALFIAVIKATLVCLFFMHLRWDRPFNSFVLVGSIAAVALFIGFAMTDTSEYQRDLIPTEHQVIKTKLDKVLEAGEAHETAATGSGEVSTEGSASGAGH